MIRKICLFTAAVVTAVLLGGSSCGSPNDTGCLPGIVSNDCPATQPPTPTSQSTSAKKPLLDVLTEAGYGARGYDVMQDASKQHATISVPVVAGVTCTLEVTIGKDTYTIDQVGGHLVNDLSPALSKALKGGPEAYSVEKALKRANAAGELRGVC